MPHTAVSIDTRRQQVCYTPCNRPHRWSARFPILENLHFRIVIEKLTQTIRKASHKIAIKRGGSLRMCLSC